MFNTLRPPSDAAIAQAVQNSQTLSGVIRCLGRAKVGSNFQLVRRGIERLGLNTDHWHRPRARQGLDKATLFVQEGCTQRKVLRRVILRDGLIPYRCALCQIGPEWQGKMLVLRLDHQNGARNDDRLENLRFLCPNCDSQTETFCGRNRAKGKVRTKPCLDCGAPTTGNRCRSCGTKYRHKFRPQPTKIVWPAVEELQTQIKASNMLRVARGLGVSDNALRKHLARYKSRG